MAVSFLSILLGGDEDTAKPETDKDFNFLIKEVLERHGVTYGDKSVSAANPFSAIKLSEEAVSSPAIEAYVSKLPKMRYERMLKEPSLLACEEKELSAKMEDLAVQHCGDFISSDALIGSVRRKMASVSSKVADLREALPQITVLIEKGIKSSDANRKAKKCLQGLIERRDLFTELLELPMLIDACCRNQMFDSALDLITFADRIDHDLRTWAASLNSVREEKLLTTTNHDNRPETDLIGEKRAAAVMFVDSLASRVDREKRKLRESLLTRLSTDVQLPECVRIVGLLRRLLLSSAHGKDSGSPDTFEALRRSFLASRSQFVETHKAFVEALLESDPSAGMKSAADCLRTFIGGVGMQYQSIFIYTSTTNPSLTEENTSTYQQHHKTSCAATMLSAWLIRQVQWFSMCLRKVLISPADRVKVFAEDLQNVSANVDKRLRTASDYDKSKALADAEAEDDSFYLKSPVAISSMALLYRQTLHASAALRRLKSEFFPLVAPIFDISIEGFARAHLRRAFDVFATELSKHLWTRTARTSRQEAQLGRVTEEEHRDAMRKKMSALTHYKPLAVYVNELLAILNEIRNFALASLRHSIPRLFENSLMKAADQLKHAGQTMSILDTEGFLLPWTYGALREFTDPSTIDQITEDIKSSPEMTAPLAFLCLSEAYAYLAVPSISASLDAIWGSVSRNDSLLDVNKVQRSILWLPTP